MADPKHMVPNKTNKIHTAKSGKCPNKGSCNYKTNCDPQLDWKPWESHHILSVSCVNGYGDYDKEVRFYIRRCYRETEWCINQNPNLIALPKKVTYIKNSGSRGLNLPSHDLHHIVAKGYCSEVLQDFKNKIWNKLKKAQESHNVEGKSILTALKKLEKSWKQKLKRRGDRNKGTRNSWNNCKNDKKWIYPFSMASNNFLKSKSWPLGPLSNI